MTVEINIVLTSIRERKYFSVIMVFLGSIWLHHHICMEVIINRVQSGIRQKKKKKKRLQNGLLSDVWVLSPPSVPERLFHRGTQWTQCEISRNYHMHGLIFFFNFQGFLLALQLLTFSYRSTLYSQSKKNCCTIGFLAQTKACQHRVSVALISRIHEFKRFFTFFNFISQFSFVWEGKCI